MVEAALTEESVGDDLVDVEFVEDGVRILMTIEDGAMG
jgi:hypothetical protein